MISIMVRRGISDYRCSNCMMIQNRPLQPNCWYCGDLFSNYETIMIKEFKDNEEDLYREAANKDSSKS